MRSRRVVGEKLKVAREDLWLTKTELAEKAGVSVATISQIENEHNPYPRRDTIFAIAQGPGRNEPKRTLRGSERQRPFRNSPRGKDTSE